MPQDATSPSHPRPASARPDDIEASLQAAYVHVHRYFRHWLHEVPGGERLAHDLAGETLARIAKSFDSSGEPEPQLIACWLAVAHLIAQELANATE